MIRTLMRLRPQNVSTILMINSRLTVVCCVEVLLYEVS